MRFFFYGGFFSRKGHCARRMINCGLRQRWARVSAGFSVRRGATERGGEFVIVIAQRGRTAIAITARHCSYQRARLLRTELRVHFSSRFTSFSFA